MKERGGDREREREAVGWGGERERERDHQAAADRATWRHQPRRPLPPLDHGRHPPPPRASAAHERRRHQRQRCRSPHRPRRRPPPHRARREPVGEEHDASSRVLDALVPLLATAVIVVWCFVTSCTRLAPRRALALIVHGAITSCTRGLGLAYCALGLEAPGRSSSCSILIAPRV